MYITISEKNPKPLTKTLGCDSPHNPKKCLKNICKLCGLGDINLAFVQLKNFQKQTKTLNLKRAMAV